MSVAGIDFGSHLSSVALWFPEKNSLEVMADDLGSRNIPSAVAYRGEEIVTSQAAITQQYKNPSNTFDDVRSLLTNKSIQTVTVPALEKEISVQELASHFFRNIHNQIKQQVGHAVRDCVVSIPVDYDDEIKQRITESAQAGGMRIKSFILDSTAAIMSQELDDFSKTSSRILVVDIGWTLTTVTVYDVSGGVFVKIAAVDNKDVCGSKFVQLMADHCAKEFQRKNKFPCADNKRAMTRLKRECEVAMKSLSTGAEATIDLDSLCEGADYSSRLSKARFEDLLTIPFMHLKNTINSIFAAASIEGTSIEKICLSGGPSAIPKVVSTVKALLPHAELLKSRFEYSEVSCVGAALQARHLLELVFFLSSTLSSTDAVSV